eukprot:CAMPEP_0114112192 /NCGR_PEP_ID=MMETSP0043_2-20121206/2258_1 /TAXON_ID=464988 /ORGANISM="Hemiselmis andersenii, Strain CCMP644" /LENGTH=219 /DNA_ID=CAMNT_0001204279 /DNA_START=404 /DNA_END=1059 /DNA_ORIENTATION=+
MGAGAATARGAARTVLGEPLDVQVAATPRGCTRVPASRWYSIPKGAQIFVRSKADVVAVTVRFHHHGVFVGPLDDINRHHLVEGGEWVALGSGGGDGAFGDRESRVPMVVHLPKRDGGRVEMCSLAEFCSKEGADEVFVAPFHESFDGDESTRRALACLGVAGYNVAFSNCEHFAHYCASGEATSHQVEACLSSARRSATSWYTDRLLTPPAGEGAGFA